MPSSPYRLPPTAYRRSTHSASTVVSSTIHGCNSPAFVIANAKQLLCPGNNFANNRTTGNNASSDLATNRFFIDRIRSFGTRRAEKYRNPARPAGLKVRIVFSISRSVHR